MVYEVFATLLLFLNPVEIRVLPMPSIDGIRRDAVCEIARRVAPEGPCVRPEDCGAFEGWMRLFGEPQMELLDPELVDVSRRASSYLCFAAMSPPAELAHPFRSNDFTVAARRVR